MAVCGVAGLLSTLGPAMGGCGKQQQVQNEAVMSRQEAITAGRRIVAYVPEWYGTNSHPDPSTLPWNQITHVNVAFAGIDKNYKAAFWTDYQQADMAASDYDTTVPPLITFAHQNHPGVAILLSIGGWTLSYRFSTALSDATHRQAFIDSCIALMNQYGFDGLDFDWEYPGALGSTSGDGSCKAGDTCSRSGDNANFVTFITALKNDSRMQTGRSPFTKKFVSAAIRANTSGDAKNVAYDYPGLNGALPGGSYGYLNIMTYDDHGTWETTTNVSGPVAWAKSAMTYANSGGMAAANLNMGVPFYGPVWNGSASSSQGANGTPYQTIVYKHLKQGLLGNCGTNNCATYTDTDKDKWIRCTGSCNFTLDGVSYSTNQAWASYDDASVIKTKMDWVAAQNFGGGMFWVGGGDSTSNELASQMYSSLNTTGSCTPSCTNKTCGDDGCGGSCGTCSGGTTCNGNNQCQASSGGNNGSGGCTAPAWDSTVSYANGFKVSSAGKTYTCIYVTGCPAGYQPPFANIWDAGTTCASCTPNCSGKQCGADSCGGSCGTCASGKTCDSNGACQTSCVPQCSAKSCGSNGCGGSCGTCPSGQTCNSSGACVSSCTPNCSGKTCGSNGCGGTCGTCAAGSTCNTSGTCVSSCTPSCSGKNCGPDGCGGQCGTCSGSTPTCNSSGTCVGTTGTCSAQWSASPNPNSGYTAGTQVSDGPSGAKHNYKCKPAPASGWCTITGTGSAYEPYFGWAWTSAWDDMGACQ